LAVDVIPEVFALFQGPLAWANGGLYQAPEVTAVSGDGRRVVETSDLQFDLILVPYTESWAAVMRALFEPGQRIHTVEAFRAMRARLKPGGMIAVIKALDRDDVLFNRYALSLKQAQLDVVGWARRPGSLVTDSIFVLLGFNGRPDKDLRATAERYFTDATFRYVDFQETPPSGEAIHDDSPWHLGLLGQWLPPEKLRRGFIGIAGIAFAGIVLLAAASLRGREPREGVADRLLLVLTGVGVGINAVYLQNGIIFWLIAHLLNPLASFFIGTSLFLFGWGLSGTLMRRWRWLLLVGAVGAFGMLAVADWKGLPSAAALVCITVGSGLLFPLLGLTFQARLLHLFVADALGGFVGGLLGIWIPVLLGLQVYFEVLPWMSLGTLALGAAALLVRGAPKT
jgi:hypothetical protein